ILYLKSETLPSLDKIRKSLIDAGFQDVVLQDVKDQKLLLLKFKSGKETLTEEVNKIIQTLNTKHPEAKFQVLAKEEIGGIISKELKHKALFAIFAALVGITLYLSFRFNFYFALAAGLATLHDVIGLFALFYLLNLEINLLFITALLTIAGYSLTDTVVIFDRIREVILRDEKIRNFDFLINKSLNEVLSRTVITTITTLFGSLALLIFGGIVIRNFALALTLGFVIGTYSSIFIASPLLKLLHKGEIPTFKEKEFL
ncbi:MAG: protein translocase subunit SecF, partial [Caldimicrobium sp.]